jgi:hypothetical protein
MKNIFLLLITLLFASNFAKAQKTQDVVFLENGSILRGEIQDFSDSSKVRLLTADGSIWVFDTSEVFKTTVMPAYHSKQQLNPMKNGFYNTTDFGILFGQGTYYSTQTASLNMVNGYQINPNFAVGLGIGFEGYDVPLAPIFVEAKYFLLKKSFSPFVSLQSGYSLPLSNYILSDGKRANKGGVMLGANIGFRKYLTDHFGLIASVGYRYQESHSSEEYYWWGWEGDNNSSTEITRYYNRFAVRFGITFN